MKQTSNHWCRWSAGLGLALLAWGSSSALAIRSVRAQPAPPPTNAPRPNLPPADRFQPPPPNRDPSDRFLQPGPGPQPAAPDEPIPEPEVPDPAADAEAVRLVVKTARVTGSTIFSEADFAPIVSPLRGRLVTVPELFEAANEITRLYLQDGYLTSRAVLVEESLVDGNIEFRVIEGSIETIEVEGLEKVRDSYVRSRIALGAKTPLRVSDLEDQLRLLQVDPLFELVEASLKAGSGVGQSIISVRVTEARPWTFRLSANNYSPPSIGGERFEAEVGYNTLTGRGDRISLEYDATTLNGSDTADFNYRIPVNAKNGTVAVRVLYNENQIVTRELDPFDIEGQFELYEISFRQPLIRTPREELAIGIGFTHQRGQTFLGGEGFAFGVGPDDDGRSITSTFRFTQEYVRRNVSGAWVLRSQFNIGTGAFGATDNGGDEPNSNFFSWLGQAQRVHVIGENNFLIILADVQLSPDPLLPSEQFVIGGGTSVRGYRQNILAGDNGVRLTVEDRITLLRNDAGRAKLQLAPFVDFGAVFNAAGNPNGFSQENTVLAGIGTGIIWEPLESWNIRLDYGLSLVDVEEGDNAQDKGFYFSVNFRP